MHQHISNFVSDSVAQADFGLATINGAGGGQHTAAAGTLRYMAPEVMQSTSYGFKAHPHTHTPTHPHPHTHG